MNWFEIWKDQSSTKHPLKLFCQLLALPTPIARSWKYDTSVREYFVETCTKQTIKNTEMSKKQEIADGGESLLHIIDNHCP